MVAVRALAELRAQQRLGGAAQVYPVRAEMAPVQRQALQAQMVALPVLAAVRVSRIRDCLADRVGVVRLRLTAQERPVALLCVVALVAEPAVVKATRHTIRAARADNLATAP